jgi:type I restriction enzyme S subunit
MPHVGGANIESMTGRLVDLRTAEEEGLKSGKFVFDESMVLYSKIRPYLIKVARPGLRGLCSADIYPLSPAMDSLDRDFLYYLLLTQTFTDYAIIGSARAGMPKVNREHLFGFQFHLPPLPEQRRIVGILDEAFESVAAAKANAEKNLRNARAVFESHLNAVFDRQDSGWAVRHLRDLARIGYGYTESASTSEVGPRFLRITDIQDNKVDWSNVPFCPIAPNDFPKYRLCDGDIVFARTGATTGKSYLVSSPPTAVFASYLIRAQVDQSELLPEYLNLYFQTASYWQTIRSGTSGSAQGGFNATKLAELSISFPASIEQQKAIVAEVDAVLAQVQSLEAIYQRKLAALEALKQSLLHQAFTGQLGSEAA